MAADWDSTIFPQRRPPFLASSGRVRWKSVKFRVQMKIRDDVLKQMKAIGFVGYTEAELIVKRADNTEIFNVDIQRNLTVGKNT
ncbi:hypothetical protein OUZ56_008041 [Daphnia magna]|uniref:Uncharacterized protein n=1 Tax=Daphnia magna TaxID=35525 RepID=A0ABR0ABT7_9CRUS|nr:hypothetical protein OUZ56_008041 [Daphnia magna]